MKFLPLLGLCILFTNSIKSQDSTVVHKVSYQKNNVYIEVLGSSFIFGSINYERVIFQEKSICLNGRIGLGYGNLAGPGTSLISVPVSIIPVIKLYHTFALDLGIGITFTRIYHYGYGNQDKELFFLPLLIPSIGFRIQNENGFLFKLLFTTIFNLGKNEFFPSKHFVPWLGVSFGYGFKNKK